MSEAETFLRVPRGEGRELRVARNRFQGRDYFQVREWFMDGQAWRPGKGIALRESELAQVAEALDKAMGIPEGADPTESWG